MLNNIVVESNNPGLIKNKIKRKPKTTPLEYKLMLQWLEIPDNFNLIIGNATSKLKSVVAGAEVTKRAGYKRLSVFVNERSHDSQWDEKDGCTRLRGYIEKYKDIRKEFISKTDGKFNIPGPMRLKGFTIDELLESKCFGFHRMDKLFGERQNITPACTIEPSEDIEDIDVELDTDDISLLTTICVNTSDNFVDPSWEDCDITLDCSSSNFVIIF